MAVIVPPTPALTTASIKRSGLPGSLDGRRLGACGVVIQPFLERAQRRPRARYCIAESNLLNGDEIVIAA